MQFDLIDDQSVIVDAAPVLSPEICDDISWMLLNGDDYTFDTVVAKYSLLGVRMTYEPYGWDRLGPKKLSGVSHILDLAGV